MFLVFNRATFCVSSILQNIYLRLSPEGYAVCKIPQKFSLHRFPPNPPGSNQQPWKPSDSVGDPIMLEKVLLSSAANRAPADGGASVA